MDTLRKKAEQQVEDAKQKSDRELERAKQEAQRIVENARRAANSLILEVERLKKEQAREKNAAEMARKAKAAMKRQLNDLDDLTAERLGEEDDGD